MDATRETQTLLHCLQALNPAWRQKEFQQALHKSQAAVSAFQNGKMNFKADTAGFVRKLIADRIAELTGDQYSYFQVQKIAKYYEDIQRGKEWPALDEVPPIEYTIAQTIATRGVAIP